MVCMNERPLFLLLQSDIEECLQMSCQWMQTEIQINGYKIWGELQDVIYELLKKVEILQKQNKKGELQYFVFSFLRYGIYLDKLEVRIDALDDNFYLDMQECAEDYSPAFLQERYLEDLNYLYEQADKRFIRLQNYELVEMKKQYTEFYNSIIFHMINSLTGLIVEMIMESKICISDEFVILYGEYMDKATILYAKEKKAGEIFSDRNG